MRTLETGKSSAPFLRSFGTLLCYVLLKVHLSGCSRETARERLRILNCNGSANRPYKCYVDNQKQPFRIIRSDCFFFFHHHTLTRESITSL